MRLQGKTVTITGGSSIGLATARLFAAERVRPFRPIIPGRND